jgi:Tfp pilus assembly protein PilX
MKIIKQRQNARQSGAVSLFVVIMSTLLMVIITVSFVQLMLKDQRQATSSDLSQSAYDSAQSGVEDAKRLLLLEQSCRNGVASASVSCQRVSAAVTSNECNTISRYFSGNANAASETMIQQDLGDKDLAQAYTCVKILADATDYKGVVDLNESNIVPLRGTADFNRVVISWFTRDDLSSSSNNMAIGFPPNGSVELPPVGNQWDFNYPSLLRTQLMQTGSTFKLADFDDGQGNNKSNANTLFLYPSRTGSAALSFNLDAPRRDPQNAPHPAKCNTSFTRGEYACTTTITLPDPITGGITNRNAYMRLSALYNGAHYKVELMNAAGSLVPFDRVQPEIDSTGRANDMFRRVKTRVEFKSDFIYPEAAVDIGGSLCKSFTITNDDNQYQPNRNCTP